MRKFLESGAAQIGVRIQSIGVNFDPEVLSLPGGTAIAVILWLYTSTMVVLKRCAPRFRAVDKEPAVAAARAFCIGRARRGTEISADAEISCTRSMWPES
jgi:hypothetical protein